MKHIAIAFPLILSVTLAIGQTALSKSVGQSLYLPIYSPIWHGDTNTLNQPERTLVSVSVSIRNTDPATTIQAISARYFDTQGKRLREYVVAPVKIGPMGTHEIFIPRADDTGVARRKFCDYMAIGQACQPTNCGRVARKLAGE